MLSAVRTMAGGGAMEGGGFAFATAIGKLCSLVAVGPASPIAITTSKAIRSTIAASLRPTRDRRQKTIQSGSAASKANQSGWANSICQESSFISTRPPPLILAPFYYHQKPPPLLPVGIHSGKPGGLYAADASLPISEGMRMSFGVRWLATAFSFVPIAEESST